MGRVVATAESEHRGTSVDQGLGSELESKVRALFSVRVPEDDPDDLVMRRAWCARAVDRWYLLTGEVPEPGDWTGREGWPHPREIKKLFGSWEGLVAASSVPASPFVGLQALGGEIAQLRKDHVDAERRRRQVEVQLDRREQQLDRRREGMRAELTLEMQHQAAVVRREWVARLEEVRSDAQRAMAAEVLQCERAESAERQIAKDKDQLDALRQLVADAEAESGQAVGRARALMGALADAARARPCYRSWLEFSGTQFDRMLAALASALAGGELRAEIIAAPLGSSDLAWRDGLVMLRRSEVLGARMIEVSELVALPGSLTAHRRTSVAVWTAHGRTGVLVQVTCLDAEPQLDVGLLVEVVQRVTEVAKPDPDGQWPFTTRALEVAAAGVDGLVSFLRDPARSRPILILTGTGQPDRLAAQLYGAAHVVRLDRPATRALTDRVGAELGVRGGDMRYYRPGFGDRAPSAKHPRLTASELPQGSEEELERALVLLAAAPGELPPSLAAVIKLTGFTPVSASEVEDHANQALRQQVKTLQSELSALHASNESQKSTRNAQGQGKITPPATVLDAAIRAQANAQHLLFADRALKSASESPFRRPADILERLSALDRLAGEYIDGPMGMTLSTRARQLGLNWGPGISDTARRRFAEEYTFTYDGHQLQMGPHIVVGSVRADELCARIYLYVSDGTDDLPRGLIVGHIGRHLPGASS